jgi:putative transposase
MSHHVRLIAVPHNSDGLDQALEQTHGRYACYWNIAHQLTGHVWQGRYDSCPLNETHLWEALRHTELNPLSARLVSEGELWPWSSAASHCGARADDESNAGNVAQPLNCYSLAGLINRVSRGRGAGHGK